MKWLLFTRFEGCFHTSFSKKIRATWYQVPGTCESLAYNVGGVGIVRSWPSHDTSYKDNVKSELTFLRVHHHLDVPHNFAPEICQNTEKPVKHNGMNYLFIGLTNVSMYMTAGILDRFSYWISTKPTPFKKGKLEVWSSCQLLGSSEGPAANNHPVLVTRFDHQNGVVMHIYISGYHRFENNFCVISWWASSSLLLSSLFIFLCRIWCLSIKADWIN